LRCFPYEAAETTIVEISAPIAMHVAADAAIDAWAVSRERDLYNVYVVREPAEIPDGSFLKAQTSMIATDLSLPALGRAVDILAKLVG
jgi:hypothetical protein